MRDMTVTRAARHGARTEPIPRPNRTNAAHNPEFTPISPDEWATIIQLAREQRTEEAITAYATRRTA